MSEEEMKEAISSLLTLWRDEEWWEEQGISSVRPTLKVAADAARQLAGERDEAVRQLEALQKSLNHVLRGRDEARTEVDQLKAEILQDQNRCNPYVSLITQKDLDEARAQIDVLTKERDKWKKAAFEITEQANKTLDNLTEEPDIARADFEKVVTYNTRLQNEREKLRVEVERLTRELEQAISERTPHDYGILKDQRDDYRDRLCASIKETQEVRTEVEQLKQALHDARLENSGQAAQLEQCREDYRVAHIDRQHYKRIAEHRQKELSGLLARPEPSRLEIAAEILAAIINRGTEVWGAEEEATWAIKRADALIEAAKEGAK
jgi:chromosome segregation ATPase